MRAQSPRHDSCVKPKRASRKSVEEPLGKRGGERKVPEESDKVVRKRRGRSVSKPAQEDQPQSGKKTAGRSRGLGQRVGEESWGSGVGQEWVRSGSGVNF